MGRSRDQRLRGCPHTDASRQSCIFPRRCLRCCCWPPPSLRARPPTTPASKTSERAEEEEEKKKKKKRRRGGAWGGERFGWSCSIVPQPLSCDRNPLLSPRNSNDGDLTYSVSAPKGLTAIYSVCAVLGFAPCLT